MTNAIKFDLSKVVPVVVPANTVEGKPHRAFHDLAIAYRLKDGEDYTTVITDVPVSEEELYTHAMENMERPILKNLSDVLKEMDPDFPAMETPLWFGGNKEKCCGANCLLHKEFLEEVATKLGGGNYYILPSSIHEVLFVAMSEGFTPDTLREIVRDVNAQEVRPEDQLSDNVYVYDVNTHEMEIVH